MIPLTHSAKKITRPGVQQCQAQGLVFCPWLLPFLNLVNLLLDHVELPHVLDLAVHLVNFFGWMGQGDHSETFLLLALFYQSTPSCSKVFGGVGGKWAVDYAVGCPCDFSVSPWSKSFFLPFLVSNRTIGFTILLLLNIWLLCVL